MHSFSKLVGVLLVTVFAIVGCSSRESTSPTAVVVVVTATPMPTPLATPTPLPTVPPLLNGQIPSDWNTLSIMGTKAMFGTPPGSTSLQSLPGYVDFYGSGSEWIGSANFVEILPASKLSLYQAVRSVFTTCDAAPRGRALITSELEFDDPKTYVVAYGTGNPSSQCWEGSVVTSDGVIVVSLWADNGEDLLRQIVNTIQYPGAAIVMP